MYGIIKMQFFQKAFYKYGDQIEITVRSTHCCHGMWILITYTITLDPMQVAVIVFVYPGVECFAHKCLYKLLGGRNAKFFVGKSTFYLCPPHHER